MMNWLRHNPMIERKKVEPGATFSLLENHWKQATDVMDRSETSNDSEGALTVISHLAQMISFLRLARGEESEQACKRFWLQNQCSDKVIKWLHDQQLNGMQLPIEDEAKLVQMLQALCDLVSKDEELLGYVKSCSNDSSPESWDGACSLASLLLEYSLRNDQKLGTTARDSFILLIQLASRFARLEKSLSQETGLGLTNVVISGLSACFAQLPTFTHGTSEQLSPFIIQLKFVDSVTHAAPIAVASTLAECFTNAFLIGVIQPALTQDEGSPSLQRQHDHFVTSLHEEIAIVTYYLQLVCENLTHPLLLRSLVMFILSRLLLTLIQRMNHRSTAVTVSTLSLFNVLLDLYLEDFWYETILKYLIPQNHLMISQRGTPFPEIDFHEASLKYVSLLPITVVEALGTDVITNHYVQYLNKESTRLSCLNNSVISVPPHALQKNTKIDQLPASSIKEMSTSPNSSSRFPLWQYKYDGEDKISHVKFDSSYTNKPAISNEFMNGNSPSEVGVFSSYESAAEDKSEDIKVSKENSTQESPQDVEQKFTTISLQPSSDETNNSESSAKVNNDRNDSSTISHPLNGVFTKATNASDGYSSLDSISTTESPSYGPFLDNLFSHLQGWTRLHPDAILMATEILSTLAASRIPLITSLLLDPGLILQPSYQSFTSLLNRIRAELDQYFKSNSAIICEVWNTMNVKDSQQQRRNSRNSAIGDSLFSFSDDASSNSFSDNFADNIRKKISNSGSIAAAFSQVFQRKSGSSSLLGHNEMSMVHSESVQPVGSQTYRYVNKNTTSPPTTRENFEAAKIMAKRAIFFTHWLLELGAIAQQLCWK